MRNFGALFAVFVYSALTIFVALLLMMVGAEAIGLGEYIGIPQEVVRNGIDLLYSNPTYLSYVFWTGVGLLGLTFLLWGLSFGGPHRDKTVKFKTPSGEIMISLHSPVENIVKEVGKEIKEILEIRQDSYMLGKALVVDVRVVMKPNVHLKEISERIQDLVSERIREIIGISAPVKVRVKVIKVSEPKKPRGQEVNEEEVPIPFRNMDV